MVDIKVPSGADVVINVAPWKSARVLKQAILKEVSLNPNLVSQGDLNGLLSTILSVDSSREVDAALWPCLERCTYNKAKITESVFDSAESRQDYYDIVYACIKENLAPLAESLFSRLETLGILKKQAGNIHQSK